MESVISIAKEMLKRIAKSAYRLQAEGNKVNISL